MEPSHTRILIVDDDEKMRLLLHDVLSDKGYETLEALDGVEATQVIQSEKPDLVILDIMMPRMNGIEVLRQLRQWSNLPVLVLSARGNLEDKTECLDLGADDYMTKPIEMKELLARVRAVLRRTTGERPLSGQSQFDDGYLRIDFDKREVSIAGREIRLTRLEYVLLQKLVTNADRVMEYDQLLEIVWGAGYQDARDSLHHCVNTLRKKIEPDIDEPRYIINLPKVGYRYYLNNG